MKTFDKANALYNNEVSGGIVRLVADLSKAEQLLNYSPSIDLAMGLHKLLAQDPIFQGNHSAQFVTTH